MTHGVLVAEATGDPPGALAYVVLAVTTVVLGVLAALHRFTDLPLWPSRHRPDPSLDVDWRSAPELPDHAYGTLHDLAERRVAALETALARAREAELAVEGSTAAAAHVLADALLWNVTAPDPAPKSLAEFERTRGEPYDPLSAEGVSLPDLIAVLEISRIGLRAVAALRDGRPLVLDPPCFHHPLHERGVRRVPHPVPEVRDAPDAPEVSVCERCAARGPEPLRVWEEGGHVPYYEAELIDPVWQVTGFGAAYTGLDPADLIALFDRTGTYEEPAHVLAQVAAEVRA